MFRRWTFAHVCKEGAEVVTPTLTHRYSPAAVMGESLSLRVVAAGLHASPGRVFDRSASAMFGIFDIGGSGPFYLEAAATFGVTGAKMNPENRSCSATITATEPTRETGVGILGAFKNCQTAKPPSNQRNEWSHMPMIVADSAPYEVL